MSKLLQSFKKEISQNACLSHSGGLKEDLLGLVPALELMANENEFTYQGFNDVEGSQHFLRACICDAPLLLAAFLFYHPKHHIHRQKKRQDKAISQQSEIQVVRD